MKRAAHASLSRGSREVKARKIEHLLGIPEKSGPRSLLEIGTGSGWIAHYFGTHADQRYTVEAVDVLDQRQVHDGYNFQVVESTRLPFPDNHFDVVISDHVIEHVGTRTDQLDHLREIRRTLKPTGQVYLAVPNRWALVEPHFKLAFLSWLPKSLRSPYLRLRTQHAIYDCEPLTWHEVRKLCAQADLNCKNLIVPALHYFTRFEKNSTAAGVIVKIMPNWLLDALTPLIPTLIVRLAKKDKQTDEHPTKNAADGQAGTAE